MKIASLAPYDGAKAKITRLGLSPLIEEVRNIIESIPLLVKEQRDANGGAAVRRLIDERFESREGWKKTITGDVDWRKCKIINGTQVCVGVEVQVSGRSDLVAVDLIHLSNAIVNGDIDIGI